VEWIQTLDYEFIPFFVIVVMSTTTYIVTSPCSSHPNLPKMSQKRMRRVSQKSPLIVTPIENLSLMDLQTLLKP
jgi:hypothetical protein